MIKKDTNIDPFTGLPNFFELVESTPLITFGAPGAIIAFDIDHLAAVNENFGRNAGDYCLRVLAELLRSEISHQTRSLGTAFRIGGDDFLLFLPKKNRLEAENIALSIRKNYRAKTLKRGFLGSGLRTAVICHGKKGIPSAYLLKLIRLNLAKKDELKSSLDTIPTWADELINNMVDRICETLTLLRQARFLALNDEITGLPNSRAANLFIRDMLGYCNMYNLSSSILLVDGDNLKQYNSLFGYQRGNQMIRDLGEIILNAVRQDDKVARWLSGDEFLIVLPGADRDMAFGVAERLRIAVETASKKWAFPVTVSIGIATCPDDGHTAEELLVKAEDANNFAKRSGKNQVS